MQVHQSSLHFPLPSHKPLNCQWVSLVLHVLCSCHKSEETKGACGLTLEEIASGASSLHCASALCSGSAFSEHSVQCCNAPTAPCDWAMNNNQWQSTDICAQNYPVKNKPADLLAAKNLLGEGDTSKKAFFLICLLRPSVQDWTFINLGLCQSNKVLGTLQLLHVPLKQLFISC